MMGGRVTFTVTGMIVHSAGTFPGILDSWAVKVMTGEGVDISGQRSKNVDELLDIPFDLVVTVCDSARETCPHFPGGGKKFHRSFDDPPFLGRGSVDEEKALSHCRRVRDKIRDFVADLDKLL
jgi:arsenate reductase